MCAMKNKKLEGHVTMRHIYVVVLTNYTVSLTSLNHSTFTTLALIKMFLRNPKTSKILF